MRHLDPTLPGDGTDLINTKSRDTYRWLLSSHHQRTDFLSAQIRVDLWPADPFKQDAREVCVTVA